jgi:hypothetical protein
MPLLRCFGIEFIQTLIVQRHESKNGVWWYGRYTLLTTNWFGTPSVLR